MKKLTGALLFACILSISFTSLTAQEKDAYMSKTTVVENTLQADLHDRAFNWLMTYFEQENRSVISRDIDEDLVSGKVKVPLKSGDNLEFDIRIDLKDNEYSYKLSHLSLKPTEEVKNYMDEVAVRIKRVMITDFTDEARKQIPKWEKK